MASRLWWSCRQMRRWPSVFRGQNLYQTTSRHITYQMDVQLGNLHEITDMTTDAKGGVGHKFYSNMNILTAMTLSADRPWWTARDDEGRLAGHILCTTVGEGYATGAQLVILPEYRSQEIGIELYTRATHHLLHTYPKRSYMSGSIPNSHKIIKAAHPQVIFDFVLPIKYNYVKYDPASDLLKKRCDGVHLHKLVRGRQFDKLVHFDTAVIHEVPRPVFLRHFLDNRQGKTYLAIDDITGECVGYGAIQPSFDPDSLILAPLYSLRHDVAELLLHNLLGHVQPHQKVLLTYSSENPFMETFTTEIMGEERLLEPSHFFEGEYSVPYKQEHFYCLASSGIVLA